MRAASSAAGEQQFRKLSTLGFIDASRIEVARVMRSGMTAKRSFWLTADG
jgi:hypothetical protein